MNLNNDARVKIRSLTFAAVAVFCFGCDKPHADPLAAERRKLEAERTALAEEKARIAERELAAQKDAAAAEAARLAADAKRMQAEREKLSAQRQALDAEKARVAAAKAAAMTDAEKAEQREAVTRAAEQKAALEMAAAKSAAERRNLEILKAQAEAERLAAERARAEANARESAAKRAEAEAAAQRTVQVFYEALAPYGDWLETDRYGFVWRPYSGAEKSWRPYLNGRWQPTDYGWTWQSHEPFGWAVYHFGRWTRLPEQGWLWVPGHEWSPAWVAWRSRGAQYVGWAPLPPEAPGARAYGATVDGEFDIGPANYTFIFVSDFDSQTYFGKYLAADESMNVLRASRNVTNISYRNGAIYCGGPDPSILASELRSIRQEFESQPLPKLNLTLVNHPSSRATPEVIDAGAFVLFAPKLDKGPPVEKPKAIREKLLVKDVDRGWSGESPVIESEWRARIKREAEALDPSKRPPAATVAPRPPVQNPTPPPAPIATATPTPPPRAPAIVPLQSGKLKPARLQPATSFTRP